MSYNASSTYLTFLMHSNDGTTYTKLVDIKSFPDLGGDPELIDTTTLTDRMRTGVPGIIELDTLTFEANYDPDDYNTLNSQMSADLSAPSYYAVWFGGTENGSGDPTPTGSMGKFTFQGKLSVHVTGGGVNEARGLSVSIAASTPISFAYSGAVSISLNTAAATVADGATVALTATKSPSDATVTWSSSNTAVATVSDGTVTGVDAGTAVITATAEKNGVLAYANCVVTVTA